MTAEDVSVRLSPEIRSIAVRAFLPDAKERSTAIRQLGGGRHVAGEVAPILIGRLVDAQVVERLPVETREFSIVIDVTVGLYAAEASNQLGPEAIESCITYCSSCTDDRIKEKLIVMLGKQSKREIASLLTELYNNGTAEMRRSVLAALLPLRTDLYDSLLNFALSDSAPAVREAAADCIQSRRESLFLSRLVQSLEDSEVSVRRSVVRAIGATGNKDALKVLITVFEDANEDQSVREAAMRAIGGVKSDDSRNWLETIAQDKTLAKSIRCAAIFGMRDSQEKSHFVALLGILTDESEVTGIHQTAIDAICLVDDVEAERLLIQVVNDRQREPVVRCRAAVAVVEILNGVVDDSSYAEVLSGSHSTSDRSITAVVDDARIRKRALKLIAANGCTEAIRESASSYVSE